MNSVTPLYKIVKKLNHVCQKQQHVNIYIQDDGVGMTDETKQNLFNRYYRGTTTDQSSEGTGLGMVIVKQLIKAHDGTIRVESAWQQGTTFTITLPIDQ